MTGFQQASLALGAAGLVSGISGAAANAQAQKQALAFQAEQRRVQQLTDKLNITQQEAAVQKNLRRVLAAQTVLYNAQGIDPSAGSPFAMQEGAYQEAQDDLDVLATRRRIADIGDSWNAAALSSQRRAVNTGLGRSITGSLLNFGKGAISVVRES
ncbi:MAG: hypothetical protein IH626_13585 [Rhodospirillales bacterium]|nr:hypothetical protein [Rhodospirillales bacterium]